MILSGLNKPLFCTQLKIIFLGICVLTNYAYAQVVIEPKRGTALRKDLLDTVRVKVERDVKSNVLFKVETLRTDGHWAFLSAVPVTASLAKIDYTKTKFAQQYEQSMFDNVVTALLKKNDVRWQIIEYSIGATGADFVDWPLKYGVPKEVLMAE
ncbi:MAG: hypothetical protein DRQ62_07875 [Gammaproteobacteria bacterium]|nr:MAG: hypothetical protein DRQ62_07875 [Gammaproteobacteria bacterium]